MIWSLVGESVFINAVLGCVFFFFVGGGVEWWILIKFLNDTIMEYIIWSLEILKRLLPCNKIQLLHPFNEKLFTDHCWLNDFSFFLPEFRKVWREQWRESKIFQGVIYRVTYIYIYMTLEKSVGFRQQWGDAFKHEGADASWLCQLIFWKRMRWWCPLRGFYKPWTTLKLLLMAEIRHQLIGSLSHYLQGFIHPRWCRISSINSST